MDCLEPSKLTADRIRHAGIIRLSRDRIIFPFSFGEANRVDRREINDVESHRLSVIDPGKTISELRASIARALSGAREKLVPGCKQGFWSIDNDLDVRRVFSAQRPIRPRPH